MGDRTKVLIWGAGVDCKRNIIFIPEEWEILAIIDSDPKKQNSCWQDTQIKVISPTEIVNYEYDFIVIMTVTYQKQILRNLKELRISTMKVIWGCRHQLCNVTADDNRNYFLKIIEQKKTQINSEYKFENRRKGYKRLFYVLAGYKKALWKDVFERMRLFLPTDMDVCLLSSGLYSEELSRIAADSGWSYLSTTVNDVAIIQNIAISLFPEADLIFKMDEDVYITKNCCSKMEDIFNKIEEKNEFRVGMVGPLIPVHTNGFLFIKALHLEKAYQEETGCQPQWGGRWINPEFADDAKIPKFLWSQGNIDDLNSRLSNTSQEYYITPVKYAICFVLFSRSLYDEMGGFLVNSETLSGGVAGDEGQIANFCMQNCYLNIVALNTLCGHFCYPAQHVEMLQFREQNYQYFEIRSECGE